MSFNQKVEDHHRLTYQGNVRMVAQQMRNPLRTAVTVVTATGEAQSVADLLGRKEYQRGEDRSRRNPENRANRSRRWLVRPTVIECQSARNLDPLSASKNDPVGACG